MADEYDGTKNDRGRLFLYANKFATTEKHPTRTGPGEISRLALRRIVEASKNSDDDPIDLRVASLFCQRYTELKDSDRWKIRSTQAVSQT